MSLGFNPNRKHRTQAFPGAVNSVVVRPTRARAVRKDDGPTVSDVAILMRRRSPPRDPAPPPPPPPRPLTPPPPLPSAEEQWTYASVAGKRVMLVYPQETHPDTGVVSMRMKTVHPVTGQLAFEWTAVYDPNTDTRSATDFSLVA